ncbi:hypothetical protein WAT24_05330 [Fulvimonas yonginensis]|uniref:Uncharacterized protein n=1 Tax=Fulvimonas yonginensis TaxID=1495200 RepID=A0ABU8J9F0_9GAMM
MHLIVSALIALATLVLLACAACREAPRRRPARPRPRDTYP